MKVYAMVLTYNRHEMLNNLVTDLLCDGIETFVIDHDSTPSVEIAPHMTGGYAAGLYIRHLPDWQGDVFNISKCWNYGLDWVHRYHEHSAHRDED